ncbi:MAG: M3 family oligoendopeptidase [Cellulosilyticaceae bacterium]
MKFKDFIYARPDYEKFKIQLQDKMEVFKNTDTAEGQIALVHEIHGLINEVDTQYNLMYVRYTIDTNDKFYEEESTYWDEYLPLYEEATTAFKKALLESAYRSELEEVFSKQYFDVMQNDLDTFSPEIVEEMKEENKLITEYNKLIASAQIEFEGKTYNLSGMGPFALSEDRSVREKASNLVNGFFAENEEKIDDIFDKMVKVRHTIAKKLGMENYVEYGYKRMKRTDYNKDMVANFRQQVLDYIVPVANTLYARQQERLGLDTLRYFDANFEFTTGNPTPQGDAAFILENGKKMYEELSPETKEFFAYMTEHELMDLETKSGKQAGGYCTFMDGYKSPFIFSNFNGTAGDVDVLTHEAGHAFQVYQSRNIGIPNLAWPTYESAEIHSMSMEFITWPWMEKFFGKDTDKYKYTHLGGAIKFIPYGVVVDAFQHFVYENPEATPAERKEAWRNLEKKFLPHKNYEGCEILERGAWWYKQGHIFKTPFYYIDYTLAQICSLQFWKKMNEDRVTGWQDYLNICDKGGTLSFLGFIKAGNMKSPFEEGCVSSIIGEIESYLMSIDDKKL